MGVSLCTAVAMSNGFESISFYSLMGVSTGLEIYIYPSRLSDLSTPLWEFKCRDSFYKAAHNLSTPLWEFHPTTCKVMVYEYQQSFYSLMGVYRNQSAFFCVLCSSAAFYSLMGVYLLDLLESYILWLVRHLSTPLWEFKVLGKQKPYSS